MVDFHGLLHQSGANMDISIFIKEFKENLLGIFGENLLFLGLQGSYGRGEAKETSDIDPVIILQRCGRDELLRYRDYIDTLPEKDIICGFVSSIEELKAWEGADRAQLILDTKPICNDLADIRLCSKEHAPYTMQHRTTSSMHVTGQSFQSCTKVQDSR